MFLAKRTAWTKAQRYGGEWCVLEMNMGEFGSGGNNVEKPQKNVIRKPEEIAKVLLGLWAC